MRDFPVFTLAFRYLSFLEHRSDGRFHFRLFGNRQMLSSIAGLVLGVSVLLIVLSIVNGFEREMRERILAVLPHAVLHNNYGLQAYADWQAFSEHVESLDSKHTIVALAPLERFQGLLIAGEHLAPAQIQGVEPELERAVSIAPELLIEGDWQALADESYAIVLGYRLAHKLNVQPGQNVKLMLPEARYSLLGLSPRYRQFTVTGLIQVGSVVDEHLAYIHIDAAQKLLRKPEGITQIRLKMANLFEVSWDVWEVVGHLNDAIYAGETSHEQNFWVAQDWTQTQGSLYQVITMTKSMLGLLVLLIVLVASFNLSSSLIMLVHEKRSDIAILLSQGLTPVQVQRVFVCQALIIASVGLVVGVLLALLLLSRLQPSVSAVETWFEIDLTSAYPVHYFPSSVLVSDVLLISGMVYVLSVLASVYPARLAARVNPAEELKYE